MRLKYFGRIPLPNDIPKGMQNAVAKINKCKTQRQALNEAYNIVSSRYHGGRCSTYLLFWQALAMDMEKLWGKKGFKHCTNINLILRTILARSRWFDDSDIEVKRSLVWYISPHQYLRIKVGKTHVDVDVWAKNYGVKFGDYAHGFR